MNQTESFPIILIPIKNLFYYET